MTSSTAEGFKYADAASYDPVIGEFDRFTDRLTRPLADQIVSVAHVSPCENVLDVGTGTGVVALKLVNEVGHRGNVIGIDLSEGMLARAREKASRLQSSRQIQFLKMDAEALGLDDASVDVVISLFALLHFPHPDVALREMYRVLRPGGRLVIGVGSGAPVFSLSGWRDRLLRMLELPYRFTGRVLTAPRYIDKLARQYLNELEMPEEGPIARRGKNRSRAVPSLVRKAGFTDVTKLWFGHTASFDDPEEFWEVQTTFSSFARKRLQATSKKQVDVVRDEFMKACQRTLSRGGKLIYPHAILVTTAIRPICSKPPGCGESSNGI